MFDDDIANRSKEYHEEIYVGDDICNQKEFIESELDLKAAIKRPKVTIDEFN